MTLLMVAADEGVVNERRKAKQHWDYSMLALLTEFAREQIEIFEKMRSQALQSDVADAVSSLRYASS